MDLWVYTISRSFYTAAVQLFVNKKMDAVSSCCLNVKVFKSNLRLN